MCVPSLVLIAQAVFLLECEQTQTDKKDTHTETDKDATDHIISCTGYVRIG